MLVRNWMSKDVVTATIDMSMMRASKILKEHGIRRLPVVNKDGKLLGIITDRDVKEASPSKATTLDVHELYYLLSEIKVKDIMTTNPYTINVDATVERAAVEMLEKKVEGLPVIDDDDKLVGIITDTDVFKVLISITGVYNGGIQLGFNLPDEEGSLKSVLSDLRSAKARIISILTSYDQGNTDKRHVYIRIHNMDRALENELKEALTKKYDLLFWARDGSTKK